MRGILRGHYVSENSTVCVKNGTVDRNIFINYPRGGCKNDE